MEAGLEAHYALLREVSARDHAIQSRLRASLPLLWTESALVMNGAARSGRGHATSRLRRAVGQSARQGAGIAVGSASEVERLLQEWRSTGRHRRMEWEVSRRIARVDRELQTKPRGRRYWHKAHPGEPVAASKHSMQREARARRTSSAVQTESALLRSRHVPQAKPSDAKRWEKTRDGHYMTPTESWKSNTLALESIELAKDKRDPGKPRQCRASNDSKKDTGDIARTAVKQPAPPPPGGHSSMTQTMIEPPESRSDDTFIPLASIPLADDSATAATCAVQPFSEEKPSAAAASPGISDTPTSEVSPRLRREKTSISQTDGDMHAYPSSIGRQVLSDYRTMPTVASFGPGPAISGHGRGRSTVNLNGDILRRLFNDLDSDHDGRINRIETCLALHRLRIAVPAARIASFFRNVYTSDGDGKTSHRPLHEVISYKQFVAFVTAAFDKQEQATEAVSAARRAAVERLDSARRKEKAGATESKSMFPSTAVPMLQKRSDKRLQENSSASNRYGAVPLRETLRYQVEDVEPAVTNSVELTDRIVSEMPDFLVSRMLADAARQTQEAAAGTGRSDAKELVRKSLEGLPRGAENSKMTTQIVQELIEEHLRANLGQILAEDHSEDLTGLMRAVAYFERQSQASVNASVLPIEDGDAGRSVSDWLGIVTEEQVSALIHEVWRESESDNTAEMPIDVDTHSSDEGVLATQDPSELGTHALETNLEAMETVCKEDVQAGSAQDVQGSKTIEPRLDSQPNCTLSARTHLGGLVLALLPETQEQEPTMVDALRLLRRKRLEQQAQRQRRRLRTRSTVEVDESESRDFVDPKKRSEVAPPLIASPCGSREAKSSLSSLADSTHSNDKCSPCNISSEVFHQRIEPEPIDGESDGESREEQRPRTFDLPLIGSWGSERDRSSSSSSSNSSSSDATNGDAASSSSSETFCVSSAIDRRVRRMNPRLRQGQRPSRRQCRADDVLSEGEVDPNDPGYASEGEITGRQRAKRVSAMNCASRKRVEPCGGYRGSSEGLYSSAESGELHSRVIRSTSSSRESGELLTLRA